VQYLLRRYWRTSR